MLSFWILIGLVICCSLYILMKYEEYRPRGHRQGAYQEIESARSELERQFFNFMELLDFQIDKSEIHASSLNLAQHRLENITSDAELSDLVQDLKTSNDAYRKETSELQSRLKDSQKQISQLKERAKQAEKLAGLDPLTGIANRRKLDTELTREVALSHERETPLCIIISDIDHFKSVNDLFGHRTGDAVLRQFAQLLMSMVRSSDIVARYGGEEFAIVLPNSPLGNAFEIAERIRTAVQRQTWIDGETALDLKLTASFGIADIRDGETTVNLINRADSKLYEAKRLGRNRTILWNTAA
jgi:diguanylate cyclase